MSDLKFKFKKNKNKSEPKNLIKTELAHCLEQHLVTVHHAILTDIVPTMSVPTKLL